MIPRLDLAALETLPLDPLTKGLPFDAPAVTVGSVGAQGWNLLGPRRIELRGPLAPACAHLTGSLWTTFTPVCTDTLLKAHEKGDL